MNLNMSHNFLMFSLFSFFSLGRYHIQLDVVVDLYAYYCVLNRCCIGSEPKFSIFPLFLTLEFKWIYICILSNGGIAKGLISLFLLSYIHGKLENILILPYVISGGK